MADERYDIDLGLTGLDGAVRGVERIASIIERLGGGRAGGDTGFDVAGFVRIAAIGAAITAVIAALVKFGQAVAQVAQMLQAFGQLQARLGSTSEQTAFLRVLGGGLGVDVGGASGRVRGALRTPLGAAAGAQAGIGLGQLDIGSAVNQGQMLMQAIDQMRRMFQSGDRSGALAFARNLNIEDLYQFVYLTNEQIERMRRRAEGQGGLFSEENIAKATQLSVAVSQVGQSMEALKLRILGGFIPVLEEFSNAVDELANGEGFSRVIRAVALTQASGNPFIGLQQFLTGGGQDAVKKQTEATEKNTQALREAFGIFGTSARARGAIPGAFGPGNGFRIAGALRDQSIRLDPFGVGL